MRVRVTVRVRVGVRGRVRVRVCLLEVLGDDGLEHAEVLRVERRLLLLVGLGLGLG